MKLLFALTIMLKFTLTTVSFAANWQQYYAADESKIYIDKSSIVHLPDGKVRAWEKFISANGNGNLTLTEIDCKQRMYTIRAMEPINPNETESLTAFKSVVRDWTEPTQYWEYIDTTNKQVARFNIYCTEMVKNKK